MTTVYSKKELFGAFDLHSNNNYLAIIDSQDKRVYKRKLSNQPDTILAELVPFKEQLTGIVVESTCLPPALSYNMCFCNVTQK